jgi:DNA gyrase/topoisomerase IV subunit B
MLLYQVTGGRNGYGAKLCNIFSTEFVVETIDRFESPPAFIVLCDFLA